MKTINTIINRLKLTPHPRGKGVYFSETYRSSYSHGSAIYCLLTHNTIFSLHRLIDTDEIYHFYQGDPVDLLLLFPDGSGQIVTLGSDIGEGMFPQITVPKGVWQGAILRPNSNFALLGTTTFPAFNFTSHETGKRQKLIKHYPQFQDNIIQLTHSD